MNKKLSKEIIKTSRLRDKILNTKSDLDRKAYKTQRNYVVSLLRKEKNRFTVIRITLIEEERIISQDHLIAKTFNEYLISIPIKNMPKNQEYESFD